MKIDEHRVEKLENTMENPMALWKMDENGRYWRFEVPRDAHPLVYRPPFPAAAEPE